MASPDISSIAIIGGGLGGLTLSIGLARHGIPHKIYESASAFAEIGAGIALAPNSITALGLIDPRIEEALRKCITYNQNLDAEGEGEGRDEWAGVRVGSHESFNKPITTVRHKESSQPGRACVHRARFLEELIKLIPPSTTSFGKCLVSISESPSTGQYTLSFTDGSTATASAVIACDGIKSIARQHYVLSDIPDQKPCRPVFTNEFAYRGMFTRDQFLEISGGAIHPGKGTMFCGPDSYAIMYPVEKGSLINIVVVKRISPSEAGSEFAALRHETNWTQAVTIKTVLSDFEAWGAPIKALLSRIQRPERWALYDHLPAPTYVKDRVALMGDSAHATTPHQGQGAGMAFEDSLILSGILGAVLKEPVNTRPRSGVQDTEMNSRLKACFRAYDQVRRPRTQEVTRTSREMGEIISFSGEGIGSDLEKIKANLDARMGWIWDVDLEAEVERGIEIAREELKGVL
ncbi:6-methylsalicylic acid decarboxylase atA [Lachnellula suecica]|uniref:6-methylsalicylic acid decarboxylase atA n=1 Tax=Lachnellula suecica TaxID=602035 RepID=A0A8T9BWV9_9HELO|nr:6-methylsalicylic acid decarboxylase atA [Lachnellula suecica]